MRGGQNSEGGGRKWRFSPGGSAPLDDLSVTCTRGPFSSSSSISRLSCPYPELARNAAHSDREISRRQKAMALHRLSMVKAEFLREYAAIFRSMALSLANSCSIGLKSGLYAGR